MFCIFRALAIPVIRHKVDTQDRQQVIRRQQAILRNNLADTLQLLPPMARQR